MIEETNDRLAAPLRSDIACLKSDLKRAMVLQAIGIVGLSVALIKLLT